MDTMLERQIEFLRSAHTDELPHSEGHLLDHLLGTRQLLVDWGARSAVCDAGLFHSVYGTEHYEPKAVPLSMRHKVRELIGEEAEFLAWVFCFMRRETFDQNLQRQAGYNVQHRLTDERVELTQTQFTDLVIMTFANTLEALPRLFWSVRRNCRAYLRPFRSIAAPAARDAFDRFDSSWWEFWKPASRPHKR